MLMKHYMTTFGRKVTLDRATKNGRSGTVSSKYCQTIMHYLKQIYDEAVANGGNISTKNH